MARKPHNYVHFQNLVEELKSHNELNNEMIAEKLDQNNAILSKMLNFDVTKIKNDKIKDKEDRLEGKGKKWKGLDSKSSMKLPRFSGKGFMGMLGDFLSTALMGIPGGLRKFLPAKLGMGLMGTLVKGMALLVAGPGLLKALTAAFEAEGMESGITKFVNSYFAKGGEGYTTLFEATSGGAAKGALVGLIAGPKGAIIGGLIGGALTGLNHIFTGGKDMDFEKVKAKVKEHLAKNIGAYSLAAGSIFGAKLGMLGGPAGMLAGAIIGAGVGLITGPALKDALGIMDANPEMTMGEAMKTAFTDHFMKISKENGPWLIGGGAVLGGVLGAKMGPPGIMAGMLLGAVLGLLGGPVLGKAFEIQKETGTTLTDAFTKALWEKVSTGRMATYIQAAGLGATLFGGAALMGLGPVGFIAGTFMGAVLGILATWLTHMAVDILGPKLSKLFGIEKITPGLQKMKDNMELKAKKDALDKSIDTHLNPLGGEGGAWYALADGEKDKKKMRGLTQMYRKILRQQMSAEAGGWIEDKDWNIKKIMDEGFRLDVAKEAAEKYVMNKYLPDQDADEVASLKLLFAHDELKLAHQAYNARQKAQDPTFQPTPLSEYRDSSINISNSILTNQEYANWMSTLVDPIASNN